MFKSLHSSSKKSYLMENNIWPKNQGAQHFKKKK